MENNNNSKRINKIKEEKYAKLKKLYSWVLMFIRGILCLNDVHIFQNFYFHGSINGNLFNCDMILNLL